MARENLEIAIRAEESARAAHNRLDRMNGSIDRLSVEVAKANAKSDQILLRLAHEDGEETAEKGFLQSKRWVITTIILVLTSSISTTAFTLFIRSHS